MSWQVPDELLLNGEKLALLGAPLCEYLSSHGQGWPFVERHTANMRGHAATWEIRNGILLLVGIRGWLAKRPLPAEAPGDVTIRANLAALLELRDEGDSQWIGMDLDGPVVPLSRFFPGYAGSVEAAWFSGTLRVAIGKRIASMNTWSSSVYERELRLFVERGVVTGTEEVYPAEHPDESQRLALVIAGVALPASVDAAGWALCPLCGARFSVADQTSWDGEYHSCGCRIRPSVQEGDRGSARET